MHAALADALGKGLDAHWLVPTVLGDEHSGKKPAQLYRKRAVHTAADHARLCKLYRPAYGLGMRTGANGIYVVDYDPPADAEARQRCEVQLAALLEPKGAGVPPPAVRTGGGGMHWHIRFPPGTPPLDGTVLWKGSAKHEEIRLLGDGGNAVLPPTLHWTGRHHEWGSGDVLPATPALLAAVEASRPASTATTGGEAGALEPVPLDMAALPASLREGLEQAGHEHDRSKGIFRAACLLRERGYAPGHALWLVTESGLPFCARAEEKGLATTAKDVLRMWAKHSDKKQAEAAADFATALPQPTDADADDELLQSLPQLPADALYGVLGEVVRAATATSEATRPGVAAATLAHFAARFGAALCIELGDERRTLPLYMLLVGPTGRGRKGTSTQLAQTLFQMLDRRLERGWGDDLLAPRQPYVPELCIVTGVASGQGLIELVRDAGDYVLRGVERHVAGVDDKRLLLDLAEFAQVFVVSAQDGSTLSMVLRDAFDGKKLQSPSRSNPVVASNAHICVLGHITLAEFRRRTVGDKRSTEVGNGMLNRFCVLYSARERLVARPTPVSEARRRELVDLLAKNVAAVFGEVAADHRSRRVHVMRLTDGAAALWVREYERLTTEHYDNDTVSELMGRREVIALSLAALLAAMNGESAVGTDALRAALAWSAYIADTNRRVFATLEQRRRAQKLRADIERVKGALAERPMTRRELRQKYSGTKLDSTSLDAALRAMLEAAPQEVEKDGQTYRLPRTAN
jgi:hypothetical protein